MKHIILAALVGVLVSGPAWVKDARGDEVIYSYATILDPSCSEVMSDYARATVKNVGGKTSYTASFGNVIGWIAGYMTRINLRERGNNDYFGSIINELAWVASWCRDNTSSDLSQAMDALTNKRLNR